MSFAAGLYVFTITLYVPQYFKQVLRMDIKSVRAKFSHA